MNTRMLLWFRRTSLLILAFLFLQAHLPVGYTPTISSGLEVGADVKFPITRTELPIDEQFEGKPWGGLSLGSRDMSPEHL